MKEFVDGLDGVHSTSLNLASLPLLKSYMYLLQIWLVSNGQLQCFLRACLHGGGVTPGGGGGGGGNFHIKRGGVLVGNFIINP